MDGARRQQEWVVPGVERTQGVFSLRAAGLQCGPGVIALLGANGSGKSTLLRTLSTMRTDFESPAGEAPGRLGYLPQAFGVVAVATVREMVSYAAWVARVPRADRSGAVDRALARTGLTELAGARAGRLSGGQRQRVGLAVATVAEPEVLLLDEPAAALDVAEADRLARAIDQRRRDLPGSLTMVSSHDPRAAVEVADDVLVLAAGEVVFSGPAVDFIERGDGDARTAYTDAVASAGALHV